MTYNFDPERWFDNELSALETRRRRGEIDEPELAAARERLVDEYEKMLRRLDIRYDYSAKE